MKKWNFYHLLVLITWFLSKAAWANDLGSSLDGLLDYAREQNPEFAAMRYEAEAAMARIVPAVALPDPILRTEWMDITKGGTQEINLSPSKVGSTEYWLMQSIPWFGKRGLRGEVAQAGADEAKGRVAATWALISAQIKSAYAQYYFVVNSQKITRELLGLVVQMEQIARGRYANGLAAQQDAVRAQVEQTNLKTELVALDNSKRQIASQINALLSREVTKPLAEPEALRSIPTTATLKNFALLEKRILEHNPDLFMEKAKIRESEKNRKLVYKNRYPDFLLGVAPTQMDNKVSEWGVMFEINIPLQRQSRRFQEHEAEVMFKAATARKNATQNQVLSQLSENLSGVEAAERTEAFGTMSLLPQTKVTFESALVGYQTGKVDFATLLDAAKQILMAKLMVLKAKTEGQMYLAQIEHLLGEDL